MNKPPKFFVRYYVKDNPTETWKGVNEFDSAEDAMKMGESEVRRRPELGYRIMRKED